MLTSAIPDWPRWFHFIPHKSAVLSWVWSLISARPLVYCLVDLCTSDLHLSYTLMMSSPLIAPKTSVFIWKALTIITLVSISQLLRRMTRGGVANFVRRWFGMHHMCNKVIRAKRTWIWELRIEYSDISFFKFCNQISVVQFAVFNQNHLFISLKV